MASHVSLVIQDMTVATAIENVPSIVRKPINVSLQIQHPADGSWWDLAADVAADPGISYSYAIRSNAIGDRAGTTGEMHFEMDNDFHNSQYKNWWTNQTATYPDRSGGGPYIPGLGFFASDLLAYDLFDYQTNDVDGAVVGDHWFQIGNRVRLMEWEEQASNTKNGSYLNAAHTKVNSTAQFGTRYCVDLPGSASVIDLLTTGIASDFSGVAGSLFVSFASVLGDYAALPDIMLLQVDGEDSIYFYFKGDGTIYMEWKVGAETLEFTSVETYLDGTSDNPLPISLGITWDALEVKFYLSSPTNGLVTPYGSPMRLMSTQTRTTTWTGVPDKFFVGASSADGTSYPLKALFSGCVLFNAAVDPRNFFPVNHHLTWHPDWLMSISNANLIGYWPFNEASGTIATEWSDTPLYFKFSGRIKDIKPDSGTFGTNRVKVSVLDWFDDAATFQIKDVPVQLDVTMDEAMLAAVFYSASQPIGIIATVGADVFSFTATGVRGSVTVLSELAKLAASEFGYIYMRGTRNDEGVPGMALVNESRHTRLLNTTAAFAITDDGAGNVMRDLATGQDISSLRNVVEIITHPADVDVSYVVVSSLPAGTVLKIPAQGSFIYSAKYLDKDQAFRVVGVSEIVSPVRTTDFLINSNAAGTGTDISNDYRQILLLTVPADLIAYFVLNDPPGVAFRNDLDVTGLSDGATVFAQERNDDDIVAPTGRSGSIGIAVEPQIVRYSGTGGYTADGTYIP